MSTPKTYFGQHHVKWWLSENMWGVDINFDTNEISKNIFKTYIRVTCIWPHMS